MHEHRISKITPRSNCTLDIQFFTGEIKRIDMKQYFNDYKPYKELLNDDLFKKAYIDQGGYMVIWNDMLDIGCDTLWQDGIQIDQIEISDINMIIANAITNARQSKGITQSQLSKLTGIYQADISNLESGKGNPSLKTIKRIADGLNMKIRIELS